MMRKIGILLLLAGTFSAAIAQQDDRWQYAESITGEDLKKHLTILASDAYEGRETGEKGQKMAAEYIRKEFVVDNLTGPVKDGKNPYFQEFSLVKKSWGEVYINTKKGKKEHLKDFVIMGDFSAAGAEEEFVFVGYGLDEKDYSDYAGLDVKGKIVVALMDAPEKLADKPLLLPEKTVSTGAKARIAAQKGAKAIMFVYDKDTDFNQNMALYRGYFGAPSLTLPDTQAKNPKFGTIYTSPSVAAQLLGTSNKAFKKATDAIAKTGKTTAGKFSGKAGVKAERKEETISTENVLGFMEGTDLKDEIVVITAHYDHIGIVDGKINNGADDDGSGTVTVLELAEAFARAKAEGKGPRRSILFMTVTGEEKGLLGSDYYSSNPVFPLANTIVDLNIDMVGRVDSKHANNPNYIYLIGSDMLSTELHQLSERVAKQYTPEIELDYTYNSDSDPNRYYYRSDHYNFAKHNIPVIFYFNGTHEDYHAPTDDVEKINFEKMEKIARLVFVTAWEIANKDQKPTVNKAR